jgi:hypothetical protein
MNLSTTQSPVRDHIRESRQQAAARRAGAARHAVRGTGTRTTRRVHRLGRGA